MKLGFDLDDVIVDLVLQTKNYVEISYGIDWSVDSFLYYDFEKCTYYHDKEVNDRIINDLREAICFDPEFYLNANLIEDAREVLQKFKRNGHEIYIISDRAKQLQPVTFKWLRNNDIPFDKLILTGDTNTQKGVFGRKYNLDMFVDDLEEHLISMWVHKKRWRKGLLLFDRPWNSLKHDGSKFKRVKDWQEILRHVGVQNR